MQLCSKIGINIKKISSKDYHFKLPIINQDRGYDLYFPRIDLVRVDLESQAKVLMPPKIAAKAIKSQSDDCTLFRRLLY